MGQCMSPNVKSPHHHRKIGNAVVPAIGFGLMSMAFVLKQGDTPEEAEKRNMEVLTRAADSGAVFWDTSDAYGNNEELIGRWFQKTGRRKEIFLATKFGFVVDPATGARSIRGDKEHVKQAIEVSLKKLGTDYVDLYYQHRVDPKTRIEETVEAMAELVKEGKVRYLGLSECSAKTLRRAHKVHPIAACQIEYSLFSMDIEKLEIALKKTCEDLGVAIVAFSPLCKGMLTGEIKSRSDLKEGDTRLMFPRFSEENFSKNLELVDKVAQFAKKKGCTTGQLALAWLLKQGDNVIPLPGCRQVNHLDENFGALNVDLSAEEVKEIREFAEKADVKGTRYPAVILAMSYVDSI